ncbi:ATP-binding protein [Massilia luteola]|uniref:ATP-binding protein n=1 Tax=Massilia luteola TaxID=3081751 RepID=UPI002ACC29E0|nr:winged helix-turn-helix domain-containing protein [Massilia sp. Gc5]
MDPTQSPNVPALADPAILAFGPFVLLRARQQLMKGDQEVRLGSRAFTLLVDLVESAGQLRTRKQLEAKVWPRSIVEETSLRVHMSALRRALGDGRDGARYIQNVPGCGYSFVCAVTRFGGMPEAPVPVFAASESRLIGRAAELQSLPGECVRTRLLSLVGPGGIGKTSLAAAVAERAGGQFADGVLAVDLASAAAAGCVVDAVAEAAGVRLPSTGRQAALCKGFARHRLLLVLDNCDRVVEGAAGLAIALLRDTSGVHVLATTREPLDVQGERIHWLDVLRMPLDAPDDPREAMAYAAVALFVARARANDDRFVLDAANVGAVCRLCRHLDGIPLAIELAAARVEALGVAGLAESLGDLLGLLTRSRRTALPRQRTMEATLAWSYDQLDEQERAVLCRSGIFQAEFSIAAARDVCACADIGRDAVARCIESLATKSLLVRKMEGSTALYRQLLLTRTYAFGKLDDDQKAGLARRHAGHVAALLALSPAAVAARSALPWVAAHGRAFDDVRAALDWAYGERGDHALGIALVPNLIYTLRFLGLPDDFRRRLMQALDDRGAPRLAPETALSVYAALAVLGAYSHTEFDLLRAILARLQALLGRVESPALRIEALLAMGAATYGMGEPALMLDVVRAVRALAAREGNAAYALMADRLEANARHFLGEHDAAQALCHHVLQTSVPASAFSVSSPTPNPVGARWNLARIAWIRGKADLAAQLAQEALAFAEQRHGLSLCQTLVVVALPVALWRGDHALAARLAARLAGLGEASRSPYWQEWARAYAAAAALRRAGRADDAAAWPEALAPFAHDTLATLGVGMLSDATSARADAGVIGWCAAEVWRVQGERMLREGTASREAAGALFLRAHALARSQQALAWELRIACSMARCWRGTPRAPEGQCLLAEAVGRLDEGLDTADCRAALALLA